MAFATTMLHIHGQSAEAVEQALVSVFTGEGRVVAERLQGMYLPVLARLSDPNATAPYRYLILPAHATAPWITVIELGNRADGLEVALSRELGGSAVLALSLYADAVAGYRLARGGALLDAYLSDPEYFNELAGNDEGAEELQAVRGQPERYADLLPEGTAPGEFSELVLRPGWWAERDGDESAEEGDIVDEADRLRCVGLALEVWGPQEYPFAGELEDVPARAASPAVALTFS